MGRPGDVHVLIDVHPATGALHATVTGDAVTAFRAELAV
jgi:hypothetical protein